MSYHSVLKHMLLTQDPGCFGTEAPIVPHINVDISALLVVSFKTLVGVQGMCLRTSPGQQATLHHAPQRCMPTTALTTLTAPPETRSCPASMGSCTPTPSGTALLASFTPGGGTSRYLRLTCLPFHAPLESCQFKHPFSNSLMHPLCKPLVQPLPPFSCVPFLPFHASPSSPFRHPFYASPSFPFHSSPSPPPPSSLMHPPSSLHASPPPLSCIPFPPFHASPSLPSCFP